MPPRFRWSDLSKNAAKISGKKSRRRVLASANLRKMPPKFQEKIADEFLPVRTFAKCRQNSAKSQVSVSEMSTNFREKAMQNGGEISR